jgi:hypothetical protein
MSKYLVLLAPLSFIHSAASSAEPIRTRTPAPLAAPTDIVVTGERPAATSSIDRKSYSVAHDLQAGSGSVADILRIRPVVLRSIEIVRARSKRQPILRR